MGTRTRSLGSGYRVPGFGFRKLGAIHRASVDRAGFSGTRSPIPGPRSRAGFTLAELLVVIVIVLLLAAAAAPIALAVNNGRALREASSTLQASVAGARDRALANQEPRGIRLIPETDNPSLVRQLRYIKPAKSMALGSAIVVDAIWNDPTIPYNPAIPPIVPALVNSSWPDGILQPDRPGASFRMVVLLGGGGDAIRLKNSLPFRLNGTTKIYFGGIRLSVAGQTFGYQTTDALLDYTINVNGNPVTVPLLRLDYPLAQPVPFQTLNIGPPPQMPYQPAWPALAANQVQDYLASIGTKYVIALGNVEDPSETPIELPSGVYIDLGFIATASATNVDPSNMRLTRLNPENGHWDIMFAPNGSVIGAATADAHIFLWLREQLAATEDVQIPDPNSPPNPPRFLRLIPTTNTGNHAFVAVLARTGLVRSAEPNFGADQTTTQSTQLAPTGIGALSPPPPAAGSFGPYWNYTELYRLYFNTLTAPDGGETGL